MTEYLIHTFDENGEELEFAVGDMNGFLNGTSEDDLNTILDEVNQRTEYYIAMKGLIENKFVKVTDSITKENSSEEELEWFEKCISDNNKTVNIISDHLSMLNNMRLQELESEIGAEES